MIRLSEEKDREDIQYLIEICFGNRMYCDYLKNLKNRYFLKIVDNKVVAMSGLNSDIPYGKGVGIDWTCTHPDYRHHGYMYEIFEKMIPLANEDIYCSCWHLENKEKPELYYLMQEFSFECIQVAHKIGKVGECMCFNKTDCVNYHSKCSCQEDLYVRRKEDIVI